MKLPPVKKAGPQVFPRSPTVFRHKGGGTPIALEKVRERRPIPTIHEIRAHLPKLPNELFDPKFYDAQRYKIHPPFPADGVTYAKTARTLVEFFIDRDLDHGDPDRPALMKELVNRVMDGSILPITGENESNATPLSDPFDPDILHSLPTITQGRLGSAIETHIIVALFAINYRISILQAYRRNISTPPTAPRDVIQALPILQHIREDEYICRNSDFHTLEGLAHGMRHNFRAALDAFATARMYETASTWQWRETALISTGKIHYVQGDKKKATLYFEEAMEACNSARGAWWLAKDLKDDDPEKMRLLHWKAPPLLLCTVAELRDLHVRLAKKAFERGDTKEGDLCVKIHKNWEEVGNSMMPARGVPLDEVWMMSEKLKMLEGTEETDMEKLRIMGKKKTTRRYV